MPSIDTLKQHKFGLRDFQEHEKIVRKFETFQRNEYDVISKGSTAHTDNSLSKKLYKEDDVKIPSGGSKDPESVNPSTEVTAQPPTYLRVEGGLEGEVVNRYEAPKFLDDHPELDIKKEDKDWLGKPDQEPTTHSFVEQDLKPPSEGEFQRRETDTYAALLSREKQIYKRLEKLTGQPVQNKLPSVQDLGAVDLCSICHFNPVRRDTPGGYYPHMRTCNECEEKRLKVRNNRFQDNYRKKRDSDPIRRAEYLARRREQYLARHQ